MIIDAFNATQPVENTLRVEMYKDEKPISATSISGQIESGEQTAFSLKLTENLEPLLSEITPTPTQLTTTILTETGTATVTHSPSEVTPPQGPSIYVVGTLFIVAIAVLAVFALKKHK